MAIKILVQAAAERPDGPALRTRDFQVLEEEILRLEQIVSGFLDFARPPRPDLHPLDVTEAAAQAIDTIRTRAELQGVSLMQEPSPGPMVLSADANQLRQVLLNLLINALDAQPQGGWIRVGVRIEGDSRGGTMALTVADAGSGIPQSMANRLFEPFVSTKESGLGLGLSICRRIAEAHGGTLSASNKPEGGATFTLRLPIGK
jgi:signal transduction histidine kinase